MPISVQTPIIEHVPNGVTTVFAYPFAILDAEDLKAQLDGAPFTAFTVSGVGSRTGGSITCTSAPTGASLILYREISLARATDYQELGDLLAETLDDDFDRAWMAIQDLGAVGDRSLRVPVGETLDDLPAVADRADRVMGFNSIGAPVMLTRTDDGGSALALDLASTSSATKGASMIGVDQSLGYAVRSTLGWFCKDSAINVRMPLLGISDGAVGDSTLGADDGTDDTAAFQGAITWATAQNKRVYVPPTAAGKGYRITDTLLGPNHTMISGEHCHMGFRSGTCINFRPASLKSFFQPTGLPATLKDGYLIENLYIEGNSTSSTGNSNIGLDIDNIIKSTFRNCRIQGFRTGIRCYATNSNLFEMMHPTSNYVQSVLYDGGLATTDNWFGGYVSNAPILVQTNGANICIRWTGVTFEGAGWPAATTDTTEATGINIVKEVYGWQIIGCYGEDAPLTNCATNAMVRVGRDGTTLAGAPQVTIVGGMWGGRNAGGVGSFLDVDYTDGVAFGGGAYVTRFTNGIKTSANTPTNAVVSTGWTCTSMSYQVTDDTKVTGIYPLGVSGSASHNQQTYRLSGDQLTGTPTACTGAITTTDAWSLTKDGIVVSLVLPAITGTASASPSFTFGQAIPSKYRPSSSKSYPVAIKNNGADQATPGLISIDYLTGLITVYKDGTRTSNFTAAATAGLTEGTVISWTV